MRCVNGAWALAAAFVFSTIAALPSAHATSGECGGYSESVKEICQLLSRDYALKTSKWSCSASNAGLALSKSLELAATSLNPSQRSRVQRLTSQAARQVVRCGGFFERTTGRIPAPSFIPAELLAVAKLPDDAFRGAKSVKSGAARELVARGQWLLCVVPEVLKLDPSSPDHAAVSALLGKERRFGRGVQSTVLLKRAVTNYARLASNLDESQVPSCTEIATIAETLGSYQQPFAQWTKAVDRAIGARYESGEFFPR